VVIAKGTGKLFVVLVISGPGALVSGAGVVDGVMLV
jgi:thiamine pyrophosphate-dependent acetolactate synthase large subunit-like protein